MCPWELNCLGPGSPLGRGVGTQRPVLRLFLEGGTGVSGVELLYMPDRVRP